MEVKLLAPRTSGNAGGGASGAAPAAGAGSVIRVSIPYVKADVPLLILFRALGVVSDRDVLEHVVYGLHDAEMAEALRPSIEEAQPVASTALALDYIGKRAAAAGVARAKRIEYAREILQKELLPHVGQAPFCETRKAFFVGYMAHRLLACGLGRRPEDDRDHYANKRLDLGGPLLAGLFRQLFRKLCKDVRGAVQRAADHGRDVNVPFAIKSGTITKGLKYSLATGNWGAQGSAPGAVRAGVSQVLNRLTYASTLSHLRRVNSPIGREGKLAKPRQLHNTLWGMMCPAETPEGQVRERERLLVFEERERGTTAAAVVWLPLVVRRRRQRRVRSSSFSPSPTFSLCLLCRSLLVHLTPSRSAPPTKTQIQHNKIPTTKNTPTPPTKKLNKGRRPRQEPRAHGLHHRRLAQRPRRGLPRGVDARAPRGDLALRGARGHQGVCQRPVGGRAPGARGAGADA